MFRKSHFIAVSACSLLVSMLVGVSAAEARNQIIVNNKCDSRVRIFVRSYGADGFSNHGWWNFAPNEQNQYLAENGVRTAHEHSKHLYFFAEGVGNDWLWAEGPDTTEFEGEKYKLSLSDNTDDNNDTPINLTCKS